MAYIPFLKTGRDQSSLQGGVIERMAFDFLESGDQRLVREQIRFNQRNLLDVYKWSDYSGRYLLNAMPLNHEYNKTLLSAKHIGNGCGQAQILKVNWIENE